MSSRFNAIQQSIDGIELSSPESPNIFKTHIKIRRPPSRSFSVSSTELETTINQNKLFTAKARHWRSYSLQKATGRRKIPPLEIASPASLMTKLS
ncbi:hypothetical protein M8J75_008880 [Diaphorina citri]|nr:hypothetical protein M8J75_008880 [Diaphorina citri]KAI5742360.1 hypothetical protein M8J77_006503 [Diaphorina citri]